MKKVVFIIAVIGLITLNSANAQIGNALKKTVKDNVKKEVPSKPVKPSSEPQSVQEKQTGKQQPAKQNDKKPLTPSAAAVAADPMASNNTVPNGYSRSYAERRAAYEQLPEDVYFKPYYHQNLRNYYFLDDPEQEKGFWIMAYSLIMANMPNMGATNYLSEHAGQRFFSRYSTLPFMYQSFITDTIPAGNKKVHPECVIECTGYMPIGLHSIYAHYALFAADPAGFYPFEKFCESIVAYLVLRNAVWQAPNKAGGGNPPEVPVDGGGKLSVDDWSRVMSILGTESKRLHDIALTETPLDVIKSACAKYYNNITKFEEEKSYQQVVYNYFLFETALYFWQETKKRTADETYDYIKEEYEKFIVLYKKKWANAAMASGPAVNMPKTYDMGADLAKKALDAAQKQFGGSFKVDKVVFISNKWTEYKEQKYPYRVMHRSLDAALLTKEDDKWVIRYYFFKQASDQKGGWTQNFGFEAGNDSNPKAVNYK